jgi:hypothetical protein
LFLETLGERASKTDWQVHERSKAEMLKRETLATGRLKSCKGAAKAIGGRFADRRACG